MTRPKNVQFNRPPKETIETKGKDWFGLPELIVCVGVSALVFMLFSYMFIDFLIKIA
ncbi:hypothetical protein [Lactobacillus sp. LL6]|uniref:hypothetical protein n=1 Tax=Lactobacillus sp. LL6 TaxID=2596827 RepID=UPI0016424F3A|nr:hypothetical protein [Lactobacillus sp. LL6]